MTTEDIKRIIDQHPPKREFIIKMMHDIQAANGQNYLPEEALNEIVNYTKLSKSAIMGVAEYYSMFSNKPRGRFLIRICFSPVCTNHNPDSLLKKLLIHFNLKNTNTVSTNGLVSIEKSECLGRCGHTVAISINKHYFDDITEENICEQVDLYIKENTK